MALDMVEIPVVAKEFETFVALADTVAYAAFDDFEQFEGLWATGAFDEVEVIEIVDEFNGLTESVGLVNLGDIEKTV